MDVSLEELGIAFRRAKADLYYTHNANAVKLLRFEKNLAENLKCIQKCLLEDSFSEIKSSWCHGWRVVPKEVVFKDEDDECHAHSTVRLSDSAHEVDHCSLRLIEDLPIEFHVITQLWIDRVASHYECKMSKSSYGYRLRMHGEEINKRYPGSFRHWMSQYREWHDGGLTAIEKALQDEKNVVTLTADFTAFYHCLMAGFILDETYLRRLGMNLSEEDSTFTSLVVKMLDCWARDTPLQRGLPVGCSISAVIANLALTLLDRKLESLPGLIYYGRYVDDIILAVENSCGFKSQKEMLGYLCEKVDGIKDEEERVSYRILDDSQCDGIVASFNKNKTRVFIFDSKDGLGFIDSLKTQIKRRSSEWRALPDLPDDPKELVRSIVAITDRQGVEIDKLRQAEEVSIRRAAFALKLADFDNYSTCLKPGDWEPQRVAFLEAIATYFTNAKTYFELHKYFPRLVSLAACGIEDDLCRSYQVLKKILARISEALRKASEGSLVLSGLDCDLQDSGLFLDQLRFQVCREFSESIAASVSSITVRTRLLDLLEEAFPLCAGAVENLPSYDEFMVSDLACEPFKSLLFSIHDLTPQECNCESHDVGSLTGVLPQEYFSNANRIFKDNQMWRRMMNRRMPPSGFLFPTRKLSMLDLYAILREPYHVDLGSRQCIADYLRLQGYGIQVDQLLSISRSRTNSVQVVIPDRNKDEEEQPRGDRKIALAFWHSSMQDWLMQVGGKPRQNQALRFRRLMRLTNLVLRGGERPNYLLFHELALPWRWFFLMSRKLSRHRISLISGVEYLRSPRCGVFVKNEAWCSLQSYVANFPNQVLIRVVKTKPAEDEEIGLAEQGLRLDVLTTAGTFRSGDVIVHGNGPESLFFSVVICSDLTDINIRARLRGKIDLLNVLAWNQDIKTFNALVTSAAYDLHAYVALDNNGEFGDTRIRGPYMNEYDRDIVQLKGGCHDYYVVGPIKAQDLRRCHAQCPGPKDSKYKPLPTGFKMSFDRRRAILPVLYKRPTSDCVIRQGNSVIVKGPNGNTIRRIPLASLKTKGRVLNEMKKLLKNPDVNKQMLDEFLVCCEECVGLCS